MSEQGEGPVDRAKELIKQGQHKDATQLLEPWVAQNPDDASAWAALGAAHFELENWPEADRAAREVVRLRPDSGREWSNLGTVLRKLGQVQQAARAQRRALALDSSYQRAHAELRKLRKLGAAARRAEGPAEEAPKTGAGGMQRHSRKDVSTRGVWVGVSVACILALVCLIGFLVAENKAVVQAREAAEQGERAARQAELRLQQEMRRQQQLAYEIDQQKRRNTIAYVDGHQSTGRGAGDRTDAQRKASWDWTFRGQWVRWTGTVVGVSGRGATCSVSMRCGSDTLTSDTRFELDRQTAVSLSEGQRIRVEGRLADHGAFGYTLTDARIVPLW